MRKFLPLLPLVFSSAVYAGDDTPTHSSILSVKGVRPANLEITIRSNMSRVRRSTPANNDAAYQKRLEQWVKKHLEGFNSVGEVFNQQNYDADKQAFEYPIPAAQLPSWFRGTKVNIIYNREMDFSQSVTPFQVGKSPKDTLGVSLRYQF